MDSYLKTFWYFLLKPFRHNGLIIFLLIIISLYFFTGYAIVSRPSIILFLSRSHELETEAIDFLKSQSIPYENPPKIFVLTKKVRNIFHWPYIFAIKFLIFTPTDLNYSDKIKQSYPAIADNSIVMQEEESNDSLILAHEVGHLAHFYSNPSGFDEQTDIQKEHFAYEFQSKIVDLGFKYKGKNRPKK